MTDRELLELAAKAAGAIDDRADESTSPGIHIGEDGATYQILEKNDGWKPWNPLNDDGDALRLAVKLHFFVSPHSVEAFRDGKEVVNLFEDDPDPYAATRRAIVRAAAEIGLTQDKAR